MATELSEQEERASRFLESIQARSRLADERREAYSAIYATFRSNEDVERHRKSLSKDAFKEALEARRPLVEDMMERNRKQMNDALDVLVLRKRPTPTAASQQANLNPSDIAAMLSHTSNPSSSSSSSSISQPMRSTTRIISARPLINNNINDKDNRDRQGDGRKEESNGGGGGGGGEGLIESDEMFARRLHEEELRSIQGSVSSDREMAPPQRLRTSDNSIPINQRNTMISSSSSSSMMAMADEDEELARALALSVEQEQQQGGGGGLYDVEMDGRRGGGSRPSSSSVPVATRIAPNATSIYGSTSSATNPPVAQMVAFAPGRPIATSTVNRSSINPTSSSSSSFSFSSSSSSSSSVQPLSRSTSITAAPSSSSLLPVRSSAPSIQFGAAGGGGGRGSSSSSHHIVLEGGSIRMAQKADKPSSSLASSSTTSIRTNGRLTADERLAAALRAAAAATTNSSSSTLLPKKK